MSGDPAYERGIVVGNVYDKYGTRNPIARRLMRGFLDAFDELVASSGCRDTHEVGCGDGHLALRLAQMGLTTRASDLSTLVLAEARNRASDAGVEISFREADLYTLQTPRDAAELIVCCEVLEHLPDPLEALQKLVSLSGSMILVSVPREPIWRLLNVARGRYLAAAGNTPGHLNHWSSRGFLKFLSHEVDVLEVRRPLPWTMALCRVPDLTR